MHLIFIHFNSVTIRTSEKSLENLLYLVSQKFKFKKYFKSQQIFQAWRKLTNFLINSAVLLSRNHSIDENLQVSLLPWLPNTRADTWCLQSQHFIRFKEIIHERYQFKVDFTSNSTVMIYAVNIFMIYLSKIKIN